jgi:hypothetical protein
MFRVALPFSVKHGGFSLPVSAGTTFWKKRTQLMNQYIDSSLFMRKMTISEETLQ